MGLFSKLEAAYSALQAGKALSNADVWARRNTLTQLLTALITALLTLAQANGYDLHMEGTDVAAIALGVATLGNFISSYLSNATNPNAGVVRRKR